MHNSIFCIQNLCKSTSIHCKYHFISVQYDIFIRVFEMFFVHFIIYYHLLKYSHFKGQEDKIVGVRITEQSA